MLMNGTLIMPRGLQALILKKDTTAYFVLVYLYMNANYEDRNYGGYTLHRGELILSRRDLAKDLNMNPNTVGSALQRLQKMRYIDTEVFAGVTKVNVLCYPTVQEEEESEREFLEAEMRRSSTHRTGTQSSLVTLEQEGGEVREGTENSKSPSYLNKNKRKSKNKREEKNSLPPYPPKGIVSVSVPSFEEFEEYCREHAPHVIPQEFYDHYQSVGWQIHGQPIVDWTACLRGWERRKKAESEGKKPGIDFEALGDIWGTMV